MRAFSADIKASSLQVFAKTLLPAAFFYFFLTLTGSVRAENVMQRGQPPVALSLGDAINTGQFHNKTAVMRLNQAVEKWWQGDYKNVLALMQTNLAMPEVKNDDYLAGSCFSYFGGAYSELGDHHRAIEALAASAARYQRVGCKNLQSYVQDYSGAVYERLGQFREAANSYRRAFDLDEQGEDYARKLKDGKALARMQDKAGDSAGAIETWQQLLRDMEKEGDLFEQGECCFGLAGIYERQGKSGAAAELRGKGQKLQREQELEVKKLNWDPAVEILSRKASEKLELKDYKGAYAAYEAMLAEARKHGFKNGIVIALSMLAGADSANGRAEEARKKLEEAVRLAHEEKDDLNEGATLAQLGIAYVNLRDFATGLSRLEQARLLDARAGQVANEMSVLNSMRTVYSILGDFPKILSINSQLQEIARRSGRKRFMLSSENYIGRFYGEIGDTLAAVEHYARALELANQLGNSDLMAEQLNEYGIALMNAGDQDGAIDAFRRSLDIADLTGGHVNLAESLLFKGELEKAAGLLRPISAKHIDMGYYYLRNGQYKQAQETYMGIISSAAKTQGYLGFTKPVDEVFASRTGLGLAYEGLHDYFKAAYHYKEARKLLEQQRDSLSLENRLRFMSVTDWMMPHLEPYEGMVRISEFLPGGLRDSLYHAEFTRGRLFTESAARNYGTPDTRLPAELAIREEQLDRKIYFASANARAASRATSQENFIRLDAELMGLKKEQEKLAELLRIDNPEYAAVRYPTPLHVEEFALQPDEVLLEFEVTEPYTKVFLVRNGRVALSYNVPLSRDELTALVRRYRAFFEEVSGMKQLAAFDPALGHQLYDLLLKPALEAEENGKPLVPADARLILAPDEILSILPFESLVVSLPARLQSPSGRFGPAPVGIKYVADGRDIAYTHSGTALTVQRRLKPKAAPSLELLVLADPIFNPADSRLRGTAQAKAALNAGQFKTMGGMAVTMGLAGRRRGTADVKTIGKEDFFFPRLDKTGLLADVLRNKIFRGQSAEVLIGSAAAKSGLLSRDLSEYRYLVLATHGILDNMVPGLNEPALVLNQVGNAVGDNGMLTMGEVMHLRLNADVVALTACQTGIGEHLTGEGVMGLGRAFQYAGARNVLVSLWNVSEGSTTMLAERFFTHLRQGKTKREALRQARGDVRRAGYEHPFYWAPFILIGE